MPELAEIHQGIPSSLLAQPLQMAATWLAVSLGSVRVVCSVAL